MTEHEEKARRQRSLPLLTTVSFRQINFVLEQNVLNDTGSVPVGKALPSPTSPWQFAKIVHSHQPSLRLQAAARRKTIGSWAQNTSLLDADCSSIGSKGEKKKSLEEKKKQYHNTDYLSLSPSLTPLPPPETSTGSLRQVPKYLKKWHSTKVILKSSLGIKQEFWERLLRKNSCF